MRILKYMIFLVAILAFMVFLGHEEALSPTETTAIADFQTEVLPEENTKADVVTEKNNTGNNSSSTSTASTKTPSFLDKKIPNGTVLEDFLHVRSGPGLNHPVITQLYKGDAVIIGENHNGWYELLLDGRILYVFAEYVSLSPIQ
jgi:hypothetical protein